MVHWGLKGINIYIKLTSNAIRVPVPNGSLVVLNLEVNTETSVEAINAIMKKYALEGELVEQINGKTTLVVEIKSLWDDDFTLTDRALKVLSGYNGPVCVMSFDPTLISRAAATYPDVVRGITADRVIDPYYNMLPIAKRLSMQNYWHLPFSRPHFVSFDFSELPFQPITLFRAAGHPILTWTIHSDEQAAMARRYCDQITFENFVPAVR